MTIATAFLDTTQHPVPLMRAYREHADRDRRMATPVVVALGKAGLWRMGPPRSRGGLEGPLTCPNVVEAVVPAESVMGLTLTNPLIDAWSWTRRRSTLC
jgi:hypothetical protein